MDYEKKVSKAENTARMNMQNPGISIFRCLREAPIDGCIGLTMEVTILPNTLSAIFSPEVVKYTSMLQPAER